MSVSKKKWTQWDLLTVFTCEILTDIEEAQVEVEEDWSHRARGSSREVKEFTTKTTQSPV